MAQEEIRIKNLEFLFNFLIHHGWSHIVLIIYFLHNNLMTSLTPQKKKKKQHSTTVSLVTGSVLWLQTSIKPQSDVKLQLKASAQSISFNSSQCGMQLSARDVSHCERNKTNTAHRHMKQIMED